MTPALIEFVKRYEGLRLRVYRCPAGYPTIGYGHVVGTMSHPPISREQAALWLGQDLVAAQKQALSLVPDLTGPRLDALTDLVYNVGLGALDGANPNDPLDDAGVIHALRRKDWKDAAKRFRQWCHARVDGKLVSLPGLVSRRNEAAEWIERG